MSDYSKDLGDAYSKDIGAFGTIGGVVVLDKPFKRAIDNSATYSAIYVRVGSAPNNSGTLVLEDSTGVPVPFQGVISGEYIPLAKARRVLSGPVVTPDGTFSTDCTMMTWLGGVK